MKITNHTVNFFETKENAEKVKKQMLDYLDIEVLSYNFGCVKGGDCDTVEYYIKTEKGFLRNNGDVKN